MDNEAGDDPLRCAVAAERNLGGIAVRRDAAYPAVVHAPHRLDSCVESGQQIAVTHHVAERVDAVLTAVDQRPTEAATLRDVDAVDRRCGAGIPRTETFQDLACAVRQRQGPRVAGAGVTLSVVEQEHAVPAVGQRQRQRHADGTGADDGHVNA